MNLLEVKNICKTYGSGETAVKALKDVSFSVPKGEYAAVALVSAPLFLVFVFLRKYIMSGVSRSGIKG